MINQEVPRVLADNFGVVEEVEGLFDVAEVGLEKFRRQGCLLFACLRSCHRLDHSHCV